MKIKVCFILIIILLLTLDSYALRGGGSRSSSSRSSSRFTSRKSSRSSTSKKVSISPFQWVLAFIAVGGFSIYSFFSKDKKNEKRQTRRITDAYEMKNEENMCILDEDQRNRTIDWFMNSKWTVQFKSGTDNKGSFSLKITDIVKRTDFVYEIQALGENDELGNSDIKGILLFQRSQLSICFDKVYDDREKAGQKGKWSVLVYEGVQQGEEMRGRWYYEGFEGDSQYSGEMRMVHE